MFRSVVLCALVLAACKDKGNDGDKEPSGKDDPPQPAAETQTADPTDNPAEADSDEGWYLARLSYEEGVEIPFFLRLPPPGAEGSARYVNGPMSVVAEHRWKEGSLEVGLPLIHSWIQAERRDDGSLRGHWRTSGKTFGEVEVDFSAELLPEHRRERRFAGEGAALEVAGVWRLETSESGVAKLSLEQTGGVVSGRILFASGNSIDLAGTARGDELKLSLFDGTSPCRLMATVEGDSLSGEWIAGARLGWRETLEGSRGPDFDLDTGPTFAGPVLEIPGVDLEKYRGSPLIVELAGSWCITCSYIAPVLRGIYDEHHGDGLQIVTLTYEFTDDAAYNRAQAAEFKKTYGIPWEVVAMDGTFDDLADILPPDLEDLDLGGFPVTFFVDGKGAVRGLHAGFPADPESEAFREASAELEERAAELTR